MDSYRTEEEQVEALKRWWDENGRSTVAAVVIAIVAAFGWQGWQANQRGQAEAASDMYQALLTNITAADISVEQQQRSIDLAEEIKQSFGDSTYAEFAAFHLARMAVEKDNLTEAEAQLRWVLGRADPGSDSAQLAQLRLGRVVAASGDTDKALAILAKGSGAYEASYAVARGDALLAAGRRDEAIEAYTAAQALAARNGRELSTVQAKLQSLSSLPAGTVEIAMPLQSEAAESASGDSAAEGE